MVIYQFEKMNTMKKIKINIPAFLAILAFGLVAIGCQKMDRPALGDYPKDTNPPGGPLSFYVAFDGTTDNPSMNAVDSIRANFPASNNMASIDGISGKGVQGGPAKFVSYAKPNNWAAVSQSFTISLWFKKDGQTKNNAGGNGPEYLFSMKAINDYHWSNATFFLFLEGSPDATMVKMMTVDKNKNDNWFEWVGDKSLKGVLNNQWHHLAMVYDASTSTASLYIDGVKNPETKTWGTHGNINFDNAAIAQIRIGAGPSDNFDSDDWLAASFKGQLDQFRLYSTALTAAEIQELFAGKK